MRRTTASWQVVSSLVSILCTLHHLVDGLKLRRASVWSTHGMQSACLMLAGSPAVEEHVAQCVLRCSGMRACSAWPAADGMRDLEWRPLCLSALPRAHRRHVLCPWPLLWRCNGVFRCLMQSN
ncbi:hypothetical protein COO60DRAFT_230502 [Scenedesmus sp. NREL 46B-D3]|nr:hypothetical protein COO60DRAFT_230502 [Scenedesmus sp. NREL 46B-D3]